MKASEFIDFNPKISLKKGTVAKKIAMDKLMSFTKKVSDYEIASYSGGAKFYNGDTIMARITPCLENGKTAYIDFLKEGEIAFGSTEFIVMRAKEGISDSQFIYYLSISPYFREIAIKSMVGSSGRQRVQQSVLEELELLMPPLEEQEKIGQFLKNIDDKIALNQQINNNLEQQAQAIFTDLFLNDSKRQKVKIKEITMNITDGVHSTVKDDPNGEYYLLSCKNIKGGTLSLGATERRINRETFEKLRKRTRLEKGDILLSSVGTVGELLLLNTNPTNYEFQRSVAMIKPNYEKVSSYYLYEALLAQKSTIVHAAHGAVQQCLFISDISDFVVPLPLKQELLKFDSIMTPIFNKIQQCEEENKRLINLRNCILPKLMLGEIDVSNLQI